MNKETNLVKRELGGCSIVACLCLSSSNMHERFYCKHLGTWTSTIFLTPRVEDFDRVLLLSDVPFAKLLSLTFVLSTVSYLQCGIFNADMVSEEARLRTFFYASPRKDWPVPERLAQAGFYFGGYEEDRDDVICHCCGLALKSWGNREIDPLEVHRELAKECAFVRELDTAGGDNVGVDARSSSPENVKTSASLLEGEAVPAFFSRPSLHRILSQESDPGLSESLESSKKLNVVLPSRPLLVTPTSCDAQGFGETNGESSCAQMSPFAQTSSSAQMSPCSQMSPCAQTPHAVARSPTYALVMPHGDLSEISKRLVTFVTWPVHSTMEPVELAKAGFYYLGRDDCVKCYKCGVTIRSWEPSDEAWAEHKRHSPFCELVIQKTREDLGMVQDYHFQRQPAAVGRPRENPPLPPLRSSLQPLLMPSPTSVTLRPSPRLMPAEFSPYQARSEPQMRPTTPEPRPLPPVFSRSPDQAPSSLPGLRVASPRSPYEISAAQAHYNHGKEDSFRVSAHPKVNNAVHAVRSVESSGPGWTGTNVNLSCSPVQTYAALPCAQFSSTKLNDAVMPPLPLPRYGLAGSHSCNYTDLEIDRLLDLGLLRADIEGTLRDRLALCGQSFQSLDDFAAAALFYQERKTLAGSPWCVPSEQRKCVPTDEQRCLSTEERKRVLTEQLNVRAAKSPEIPCSSPPEPSDSQACKICMDAFVSVLFIPCGHLVTCATCAETLKLCPICRSEIRSTHKAFLS